MRYEDLVEDSEKALRPLCNLLNIDFSESMTYPSWNSQDLTDNIYPWGTINRATPQQNKEAAMSLSLREKDYISKSCELLLKHFGYEKFGI